MRAPGRRPAPADQRHAASTSGTASSQPRQHTRSDRPADGRLVNWNNKPARGFGAADNNWTLRLGPPRRPAERQPRQDAQAASTLASVTGGDERGGDAGPARDRRPCRCSRRLLTGGTPPSAARAARCSRCSTRGGQHGGSRLDRDLDGKIDDPGAAIMDAAWTALADAVDDAGARPASCAARHAVPPLRPAAGRPVDGWHQYVDKDLRDAARRASSRRRSPNRYCGAGDIAACQTSLWAAIDAAGASSQAAQGTRTRRVALGRDRGADQVRPRACCRRRCATRTGRPASSRSSRSRGTAKVARRALRESAGARQRLRHRRGT